MATPDTFPLFSALPQKVQDRIFELAAESEPARTRFVEVYNCTKAYQPFRIRYIPPLPPLFHATRTSRAAIIKSQGGTVIQTEYNSDPSAFYFNFALDILFLSSRFKAGTAQNADGKSKSSFHVNSTESDRFLFLWEAFPVEVLGQFQRVAVTFSGMDNYHHLANYMRCLTGMRTCYIVMRDRWPSKISQTMITAGLIREGLIGYMLRRQLAKMEARNELPEGRREELLRLREMRRVVEVEKLVLDEAGGWSLGRRMKAQQAAREKHRVRKRKPEDRRERVARTEDRRGI